MTEAVPESPRHIKNSPPLFPNVSAESRLSSPAKPEPLLPNKKRATRRPPLGVAYEFKTAVDAKFISLPTVGVYLLFEKPSIVETTYSQEIIQVS